MMDLKRLDELLASHDRMAAKVKEHYPKAEPALIPKEIIAAARSYRDLANGERVEPDYEAAANVLREKLSNNGFKMKAAKIRAGHWTPDIIHAAIGDRLLIDPPADGR